MPFKTIKFNDGRVIPQLGFGTWKIPVPKTVDNVETAFEVGFDHIDTAQVYGNETEVGTALKETGFKRSEIWITTKWSGVNNTTPTEAIGQSLEKLGLSYVDLYLIHSPRLVQNDVLGGWEQMEQIQKAGLAKSIGVSNFQIADLEKLASAHVVPACNQIKLHPYVYKATLPLMEYCAEKGIVIEAYSPLIPLTSMPGGPVDKPVNDIAKRLDIKPEQVLLAWIKAKGAVILTTSSKKERLVGYEAVADIELTDDDVAAIDEAGAKGVAFFRRRFATRMALGVALQISVFAAYKYWMGA